VIGVGIVGTVLGVAIAGGAYQVENRALYFPWALPTLVVGRPLHNVEAALLIGGALGLVATLVGCLEFCKREVV
jgi:hypothetical protein